MPFGRHKEINSSQTPSLLLVGIVKTVLYFIFLFYFISFEKAIIEERPFWRLSLSDRKQWSEHDIYIAVWHCKWPCNIWQLSSAKGPRHELSLGLINFCFRCKWSHLLLCFSIFTMSGWVIWSMKVSCWWSENSNI